MPIESGNLWDTTEMQEAKKVVTNEEIWRIEAVKKDVDDAEKDNKMKWFIEKESKDELKRLKTQCLNVIKAFDWTENTKEEAAKAILSLLKINQILWIVNINWWTPIDLSWNCFNQLVTLIWTKWFDFKTVLWDEEWEIVNAACRKGEALLKKPTEEEANNIKKKENLNTKGDEISRLKELSSKFDQFWVGAAFIKLRKYVNSHEDVKETFKNDVFWLIDICCESLASTTWELDEKFSSDKIAAFQELVRSNAEQKWWVYQLALDSLTENWKISAEKVVDWKLWRNTLKCLIQFVEDWLKFEPKAFEEKDWAAKIEKWTEKKETWESIDRMPTTLSAIKNFWKLEDVRWFKVFKFNDVLWKWDFVKKEVWSDKKFVEIWWKKYYINLDQWDWEWKLQFRNKPVMRNMYGDAQKTTDLCFGEFDENWNLKEWSKISIDSEWRQIWSVILVDKKVIDEQWNSLRLWLRTKWWGEKVVTDREWNERTTQNVRWRIDLFTEEWKDTKRLSEEQLNAILKDPEACSRVLDLAIQAYTDTMHEPTKIGQRNLRDIMDGILKGLSEDGKKLIENTIHIGWIFESSLSPDERVKKFLRLEHGLSSNPKNKVNKEDLDAWEWSTWYNKGSNAEKREFRSNIRQWDRIINRLKLLQKALAWKTDVAPTTPKPEEEKKEVKVETSIWTVDASNANLENMTWRGTAHSWTETQIVNPENISAAAEWIAGRVVDAAKKVVQATQVVPNPWIESWGELKADVGTLNQLSNDARRFLINNPETGSQRRNLLNLTAYSDFDEEMLQKISEYKGPIQLDWNKIKPEVLKKLDKWPKNLIILWDNLPNEVFDALSNRKGPLSLPKIDKITVDQIVKLNNCVELTLDGIENADAETVAALSRFKWNSIFAEGMKINDVELTKLLLSNYKWTLLLNSIGELNKDIVESISCEHIAAQSAWSFDLTDEELYKAFKKLAKSWKYLWIEDVQVIYDPSKMDEYRKKWIKIGSPTIPSSNRFVVSRD